jgi:hypothetical protein
MLAVALPAVIAAVLCIGLNKLTGPKDEDKAHLDYLLTHQDELFAAVHEDFDSYVPDNVNDAKAESEATGPASSPEQVDGG